MGTDVPTMSASHACEVTAPLCGVVPTVPLAMVCQSGHVEFTVLTRTEGDASVVAVTGELDAHVAPQLAAAVDPLAARPEGILVIDLSEVGFVDSTGLGVLVSTLKHVREAGGRLDVVVSSPRVLKVLALTGLDVVIPLHGTLDEALGR